MTQEKSPTENSEAAASAGDREMGLGPPAVDSAGIASLALNASAAGPAVTEALGGFLHEQQELARRQRALLEHRIERAGLEKEHIEAQNHHLHLQHIHDRLRLVLDIGLAALGVALLVGLIWTIYDAATDRSIVVNAFEVPAALEPEGHTGAALASTFLDALGRLSASNRHYGDKRALVGALDPQVQVEIPEMHISFSEFRRLLHEALGHRTQIRGDLVETADGVALTLRGTDLPGRTFSGKRQNLSALITQAAEYVYGHADPIEMAYFLHRAGRLDEAIAFVRARFPNADRAERAALLNVWGNVLADEERWIEALAKYRSAIALEPAYWNPYTNSVTVLRDAGREAEALQMGERWERAAHRGEWREGRGTKDLFAYVDLLRWDLPEAIRALRADLDASAGHGSWGQENGPFVAFLYGLQHDPAEAELLLQTSPDADVDAYSVIEGTVARGVLAFDRGDFAAAAQSWDDWMRKFTAASAPVQSNFIGADCWLPIVYEMANRREDADAALERTAAESYVDCYRMRGDLHDHRGDFAQAQKDYAAGVALAPSLPPVYLAWGAALLRHRQYNAAIEKLKLANEFGPHWADPLKVWGDALVKQGHTQEALVKYNEALKYAPNWAALKEARAAAAKHAN
jgi:tetratricopeptide (TPR) repeat protein